jgi:hypothetical protein
MAQMQVVTVHREYASQAKMERDIKQMTEHGWQVVNVTEREQRAGGMRLRMLGLFAAVSKPKTHYFVTFSR